MIDPEKCTHPGVFPVPVPPPEEITCEDCGRHYVRESPGHWVYTDPEKPT